MGVREVGVRVGVVGVRGVGVRGGGVGSVGGRGWWGQEVGSVWVRG